MKKPLPLSAILYAGLGSGAGKLIYETLYYGYASVDWAHIAVAVAIGMGFGAMLYLSRLKNGER